MATISTLAVNLIARTSVFEKRMKASRKTVKNFRTSIRRTIFDVKKFTRSIKSVGSAIRRSLAFGFRPITTALRSVARLAKAAAVALLAIGVASVKIAADTEETANLFDVSMGSMADSANKWVTEYSRSLGLFEGNTKKAVSTFQLMLTSMGFGEEAAFEMSKGLVKITNDIASFRNLKLDEAFTKVSAGLTGEAEPLKRIGILLNETTIKQLAMNDATRDSTAELTELEKVQFRYQALINATEKDQGDFLKTINSTTNVFKIIKEQIMATGNTIGNVFIEDVTEAGRVVRDFFVNNQSLIERWANTVKDSIGVVVDRLKIYFELAKRNNFEAIFNNLGAIFGQLTKGVEIALVRIRPLAVNIGTAIGEGFWASIENTALGRFISRSSAVIGTTVDAARIVTPIGQVSRAGAAALGTRPGGLAFEGLLIASKATTQATLAVLDELKNQRKLITDGVEVF